MKGNKSVFTCMLAVLLGVVLMAVSLCFTACAEPEIPSGTASNMEEFAQSVREFMIQRETEFEIILPMEYEDYNEAENAINDAIQTITFEHTGDLEGAIISGTSAANTASHLLEAMGIPSKSP